MTDPYRDPATKPEPDSPKPKPWRKRIFTHDQVLTAIWEYMCLHSMGGELRTGERYKLHGTLNIPADANLDDPKEFTYELEFEPSKESA